MERELRPGIRKMADYYCPSCDTSFSRTAVRDKVATGVKVFTANITASALNKTENVMDAVNELLKNADLVIENENCKITIQNIKMGKNEKL